MDEQRHRILDVARARQSVLRHLLLQALQGQPGGLIVRVMASVEAQDHQEDHSARRLRHHAGQKRVALIEREDRVNVACARDREARMREDFLRGMIRNV